MSSSDEIAKNITFDKVSEPNLISYSIKNNANGDSWNEIKLIFNGNSNERIVTVPKGSWKVIARDGKLNPDGLGTIKGGKITVEPVSALILVKE